MCPEAVRLVARLIGAVLLNGGVTALACAGAIFVLSRVDESVAWSSRYAVPIVAAIAFGAMIGTVIRWARGDERLRL